MASYLPFLLFSSYIILVVGSTNDLFSLASSGKKVTAAETFQCPSEVCRCGLDPRGRVKVVCDRGDMADPIPVRAMDPLTEVLIISAPEENPNTLTIGPIFQSLSRLEELKIVNSFVPAIGKHSFWGLRSLRILDLSSNNISALVESNFRGLISLEELRLDYNIIVSIPSAAFRHLSALRRLSLTNNQLSEFVPRLFYGLHRLQELDLSANPLKELEPEVFRDVRLLQTFRCRSCELTYINPLLLHLLPDITVLDLGENGFHYLDKNAFGDLQRLRHLLLDGNQITILTSGVFSGHNMTTLSLSRNRMMAVDPSAFVNVSIVELDISYNRLQSLDPVVFTPLNRSLTRLKIGGNPLQVSHLWSCVLSPRASLNLSELDVADIPMGRDQHFQPDLFSFHKGLKSLNMSGTALSFLPVEMIQTLPLLKSLDISRNQLSSLTDLTLSALTTLQNFRDIRLHENPWYCDACVIGPMLKWLDISPATRRIKDSCRGLQTNISTNFTGGAGFSKDDGSFICPACRYPPAVSGVELPRLDHVNLPTCNYPPSLMDSHGLPSKVRVGSATSGGNVMSPTNRFVKFIENPLYVALVCGLGVLIMASICAAVAIVSRHAASYKTHEGRRGKAAAAELATATLDESEGLFPLRLVSDEESQSSPIVKIHTKGLRKIKPEDDDKKEARGKANRKVNRKDNSRITSVTSRGVHCPGTAVYPVICEQGKTIG